MDWTQSATGLKTYYQYNAIGQRTAVIQAVDLDQDNTVEASDTNSDGVPDSGPELIRTSYQYNALGQQFRVTDAAGNVTESVYDELGRVVKTIFDDDTFTQMLYGVGSNPVDGHAVSGQSIDG